MLLGADRVHAVRSKDGAQIPGDVVVGAVGIPPSIELAKVCADHLVEFGIARYQGSVTPTKLKVTGIDLFSAGKFQGGEGYAELC